MSWYQAIIFSENYFLTIQTFSELTSKWRRLCQNSYIPEFYYRILYTFQSSYKLIPIFPKSYYQTIHTSQSSYIPILIFSESYYPTMHIFHSNKPLLTNKTISSSYRIILRFSESYYKTILTFSEFMSNNKHFQINCSQQSLRFRFLLINWDNCTKCLFSESFGYKVGLKS